MKAKLLLLLLFKVKLPAACSSLQQLQLSYTPAHMYYSLVRHFLSSNIDHYQFFHVFCHFIIIFSQNSLYFQMYSYLLIRLPSWSWLSGSCRLAILEIEYLKQEVNIM